MGKSSSLTLIVLIVVLVIGFSPSIFAVNTETSDLDAEIIDKITLEEGEPAGLNFGQFNSPTYSVNFYLNPRDFNSIGGEVIPEFDFNWPQGSIDDDFQHFGGAHAASFTFTSPLSTENAVVTLKNFPGSIVGTSGSAAINNAAMMLAAWSIYDKEGDSLTQNLEKGDSVTVDITDGSGSFSVGASIYASSGQEVGTYTGTFDVQIDYQ
jgi:hypothetical protein